tara:strand:- start:114 stop:578 length:465 start_codon:yes stop_codon:yes gene_type:complete
MSEDTNIVIEETRQAGVFRARRLTLVQQWVADGKIPLHYAIAANNYAEAFNRAHLNGDYQTVNLEGVGTGSGGRGVVLDRIERAKDFIYRCNQAVGNEASAVLWDIIGCDMSLSQHATRQSWNGKPLSVHEVRGRLIVALGVLDSFLKGHKHNI